MVFHLQSILLMEKYEKNCTKVKDATSRLSLALTIFLCLFPPCTVTSFCAPTQWVNSTYTFYIYSAKLPKIVPLFAVFAPKPTPNKVPKKNKWKLMDKMSILTNSLSLVAKCFGHVSVGNGCFRICFAPTIQLQISHQWINCCRPELRISP